LHNLSIYTYQGTILCSWIRAKTITRLRPQVALCWKFALCHQSPHFGEHILYVYVCVCVSAINKLIKKKHHYEHTNLNPHIEHLKRYVDAEFSVFIFRRVMDSLYAATGQTKLLYNIGGPVLATPVMMLLGLYYGLLAPQAASRRACIEMQNPSVKYNKAILLLHLLLLTYNLLAWSYMINMYVLSRFIRRAWGILNADVLVGASQFIGYLQVTWLHLCVCVMGHILDTHHYFTHTRHFFNYYFLKFLSLHYIYMGYILTHKNTGTSIPATHCDQ
jgi:hypothetical protein